MPSEQDIESTYDKWDTQLKKQADESKLANEQAIARLEAARKERDPEIAKLRQRRDAVENLPTPKFTPPPTAPNTVQQLQPSPMQKTFGMAAIFALLSVGLSKGAGSEALRGFGGFLEGANQGNIELAKASLDDFNANIKAVHEANDSAYQAYNAVFNNTKLSFDAQERLIHQTALKYEDQVGLEKLRQGGMVEFNKLQNQRFKNQAEMSKEMVRMQQVAERIDLQRQRLAQQASGGGGAAGQSVFGIPMTDIPPAPPGQKNEAFLKMLPPAVAEIVKRVAAGDVDLKTYGGMGKSAAENRINYGNAALIYDPSFKTRQAGILEKAEKELTPGGRVGNNALAINTLPHHVDQYVESFNKLDNSQAQRWNSAKNKFATEFGDPKLGNVQASAYVVAEELARVAKGGTASPVKDEVERFLTIFNTSDSPQQAMGKVWEVLKIAGGRLSAVEESYRLQGMDKSVLTPEARELILKYKPKNVPTPDWLKAKSGKQGSNKVTLDQAKEMIQKYGSVQKAMEAAKQQGLEF